MTIIDPSNCHTSVWKTVREQKVSANRSGPVEADTAAGALFTSLHGDAEISATANTLK